MDRQNGNADQTEPYLIYVLLGLLLFSLILILLLYVMYVYNKNLIGTRSIRVRHIEEPVGKSKFSRQAIYEPMSKSSKPYDSQGPIVQCKLYEERDKNIQETSFSDTVDRKIITNSVNLPAIIDR